MIDRERGRDSCGGFLGCSVPIDPKMAEQGWQWRCIADTAKIQQIVDSYHEFGFEVRLEPIDMDGLSADCSGCEEVLAKSMAVFVRHKI